jgi:cytochrome c biogenesis protein CcmG, thiol:disulfide interchange protein DsbE
MTSFSTKLLPELLLVTLCAAAPLRPCAAQLEEGGPTIGAPAPTVRTTDLDGRTVDLARWIGKGPVLIEFWATWCTPCAELMPAMDAAHARFGDRVTFLGVNVAMNETVPGVRAWVEQHRPGFQVLYDSSAAAIRAYDIQATSTVILIGADGKVAYAGVGAAQDLSRALTRLLATDTPPRSN